MDRWRTAAALLALAGCIASSSAAPMSGDQTALEVSEGPKEGCYYNFQHYGEGDRIMTNEPCLNCTCHNRMLMCYLRVCPFTKAIGQDCTIEKRADQCCPIVTCPDVPVDLLTSTSTTSPAEYGTTGLGKLDKYGCSINNKYFPEGAKVPSSPNKPCEHCYCIRNMTTCVMQECTLHVDGCTPIYHKDVCCPVRYSCDHPEDEIPLLDDMTTTVRPTPGFLLTTTSMAPVTQVTQDCVHADQMFPDGALIKTEKACEHCYCMKGDIVCVVQECGTPMENEGKNCTSLPPRQGQCCPDTYICEGDEPYADLSTELPEAITSPPRRGGVEGSGYRNEDDSHTEIVPLDTTIEGSGEDNTVPHAPEKVTSDMEFILTTEKTIVISQSTASSQEDNTVADHDMAKDKTTDAPETYTEEKVTIPSEYLESSSPILNTVSEDKGVATTERTEESVIHSEKTTKQYPFEETTKYEQTDDIAVTTESKEKVEESNVDDKKTTSQYIVDETTRYDDHYLLTSAIPEKEDENLGIFDKKTTLQYIGDKITTQEYSDNKYDVTTELTDKFDNNVIAEGKKTTPKLIDEITSQEHLDVDSLATTEISEKIDENILTDSKKTTAQELLEETTKREYFDDNVVTIKSTATYEQDIIDHQKTTSQHLVDKITTPGYIDDIKIETTETSEKDNVLTTDRIKPTIQDKVDITTPQLDTLSTTEKGLVTAHESTREPDYTPDIEHAIEQTSQTTLGSLEVNEITKPTSDLEKTTVFGSQDLYTTTTTDKLYAEKTTSVNPIENEIIENITPISIPGRIPGEGDCLINGVTYINNSLVPSNNKCHTSCKCVSSIIKCDPIICSPPPEYMNDCESLYESPDSCCPTYICNTKETIPPQSHNQMAAEDHKKPIAASECSSSDCINEKEPPAATSGCSGKDCVSLGQDCDEKLGCQSIPVAPCEGENCDLNPEIIREKEPETIPQIVPSVSCYGPDCEKPQIETEVACDDEVCKKVQHHDLDGKPLLDCAGSECDKHKEISSVAVQTTAESSSSTEKVTVITQFDGKTDQDSHIIPTTEKMYENVATQSTTANTLNEPAAFTTIVKETVTEGSLVNKITSTETYLSQEMATKVTESTESLDDTGIRNDGSAIQTETTKSEEFGLTDKAPIIETETEKVMSSFTDKEPQVTEKYENEITDNIIEKENDENKMHETSTKAIETPIISVDSHDNDSVDKFTKLPATETPEKDHTTISEVLETNGDETTTHTSDHIAVSECSSGDCLNEKEHQAATPGCSENECVSSGQDCDEKSGCHSIPVAPCVGKNCELKPDIIPAKEPELMPQVEPSTSCNGPDCEKDSFETSTDDITEMHEIVTKYPDIPIESSTPLKAETDSIQQEKLTTTEYEKTTNILEQTNEDHITTEVNLKKPEPTKSDIEIHSELSTTEITDLEAGTKLTSLKPTERPLQTEDKEQVTIALEPISDTESHTENIETVPYEDKTTETKHEEATTLLPDMKPSEEFMPTGQDDKSSDNGLVTEAVVTSISEETTDKIHEQHGDETTKSSDKQQNTITESPEQYSTKLNEEDIVKGQDELHTNAPNIDFTADTITESGDFSVKEDTRTTPITFLTSKADTELEYSYDTDKNKFDTTLSSNSAETTEHYAYATDKEQSEEKHDLIYNASETPIDKNILEQQDKYEQKLTTLEIPGIISQSNVITTEQTMFNNQELTTDIPKYTILSEITMKEEKEEGLIPVTEPGRQGIITEPSQQPEHENIVPEDNIPTLTNDVMDVTTIMPETMHTNGEVYPTFISDNKEKIKTTESSVHQDITTKSTATVTYSSINDLGIDKSETTIANIQEPEVIPTSEPSQPYVTTEKQIYNTESMTDENIEKLSTISGVIDTEKTKIPETEEVTEFSPINVDTVTEGSYVPVKTEDVTKDSQSEEHKTETMSPESHITVSVVTSSTPLDKEYTSSLPSADIIPHTGTNVQTEEESGTESALPITTEFYTETLQEKTTFKQDALDMQPVTSTPISKPFSDTVDEEKVQTSILNNYSTISPIEITEVVDKEPNKVVQSGSDLPKEPTIGTEAVSSQTTQVSNLDQTTQLPAEYNTMKEAEIATVTPEGDKLHTDGLHEVDVPTEPSSQPEKQEHIMTGQDEIQTETPLIPTETLSTVTPKLTELEGITQTIIDVHQINTKTPESGDQIGMKPTSSGYEIETTSKPTITSALDEESIITLSPLPKETEILDVPVSLVTEKTDSEKQTHHEETGVPVDTEEHKIFTEEPSLFTTKPAIETTPYHILEEEQTDKTTEQSHKQDNEVESEQSSKPTVNEYDLSSNVPEVVNEVTSPSYETTLSIDNEGNVVNEKHDTYEKIPTETVSLQPQVPEIEKVATTPSDQGQNELVTTKPEVATERLDDITTPPHVEENLTHDTEPQPHYTESTTQKIEGSIDITQTPTKYIPETTVITQKTTEAPYKYSETTPYLVELIEHTHDATTKLSTEDESTTEHSASLTPERGDVPSLDTSNVFNNENQFGDQFTKDKESSTVLPVEHAVEEAYQTTPRQDTTVKPSYEQESSSKHTASAEEQGTTVVYSSPEAPLEEQAHPTISDDIEKISSIAPEIVVSTEKDIPQNTDKTAKPELETVIPDIEVATIKSTTVRTVPEATTQSVEFDKVSKPVNAYIPPETQKPDYGEHIPDDIPSPDFPPSGSGGYGQEPDYGEEDQAFGPGTCRYGGKVYVSAQQIPRDDPCDFCFCFRSDIICLQQSCPPPIHGCHEEPIQGFCCPRYECPVSMATAVNVTTTTTTTTTTLPPHFFPHAYKGAAQRRGCQIKGHTYKVGEVVRASSGPCLHCTCGGDGQMKCDPKVCTPEPMLRQMIAAAVSSKRRR